MHYVKNERKSSVSCYRVYSVSTETLLHKEGLRLANFASVGNGAKRRALRAGLERNTAERRESRWICPGCNLMAVVFKCHEPPTSDTEESLITRVQSTQADVTLC
jgi:hypothetical protein